MRERQGKPWIVCTHRLIPSKTNAVTPYHLAALRSVAETLFPNYYTGDVGYRTQVSLGIGERKRVVLDYILKAKDYELGQNTVILEVQGGGETSSTGVMTRHIANWAQTRPPTNEFLRGPLPKVGIIPNNAWKRQLEQIGRKYAVAQTVGASLSLVMGEVLYGYVRSLFPGNYPYFPKWEIALVSLAERQSQEPGPIPIDIVEESLFMTFEQFIDAAIRKYPLPENMPNFLYGRYTTLSNNDFNYQENGQIE
jgi:hypothetical protein